MMNVLDWILVVIRWGHALAAVAWVGGGIFYVMVLRPGMRRAGGNVPEANRAIGVEFRSLVSTAVAVLLLTGTILSVARLTEDAATIPYVAVLAVKISLAMYMFYVVRFLSKRTYPDEPSRGDSRWERVRGVLTSTTAVLITGLIVFGLSDVLGALFEEGLRG